MKKTSWAFKEAFLSLYFKNFRSQQEESETPEVKSPPFVAKR